MKAKLKRAVLVVLLACDGVPMPQSALVSAVGLAVRPACPTRSDVEEAIKDVEAEGYASGVTEDLTGEVTWTLTEKGVHKARQLR